jgi:hypothetical protein
MLCYAAPMRRLRVLATWLLMFTLPLQSVGAAAMLWCPTHGGGAVVTAEAVTAKSPAQSAAESPAQSPAQSAADCHDTVMRAAGTPAPGVSADGPAGADADGCAGCGLCALSHALRADAPAPHAPASAAGVVPGACIAAPAPALAGTERPPRS